MVQELKQSSLVDRLTLGFAKIAFTLISVGLIALPMIWLYLKLFEMLK